jgi:hypothetical protein
MGNKAEVDKFENSLINVFWGLVEYETVIIVKRNGLQK